MNSMKPVEDKKLILVSNDDGYQAPGVAGLINFLKPFGEVIAVCPEGPRSGQSMALSFDQALRIRKVEGIVEGAEMYAVNGTPVDCVKLSHYTVLKGRRPDLVVAGINHGSNAGINVLYSGTMGAVQEGCGLGIPAIGFSLTDHSRSADFSECRQIVEKLVGRVLAEGLPEGIFLNVNIPHGVKPKGLLVTTECRGNWSDEYVEYEAPHGGKFYMLAGRFVNAEPDNRKTDEWALRNGYASVTPERMDRTAPEVPAALKNL